MESHGQNRFERLPSSSAARRSLKRKLDVDFEDDHNKNDPFSTGDAQHDLIREVRTQVDILESCFSASEADRGASKHAIQVVSELAKNEDIVNVIVDCGAVPALVRHLQSPPIGEGDNGTIAYEHEVEKGSAFTLGLLAVKPEHQHLIVDAGALPYLVDLLKRHKNGQNSRAVNGVIRRAADAITNLAHENSNIKSRVRVEGGLPPLVELLEFIGTKVQRAAAGALRTLAFKNDENKNQIVECNALPTLILMLRSEDAAIHYEAVGVIGNLVHSSPNIKKEVLLAGALQPVIRLLSSCCSESQREAALLLGQFAATDSDCKVHIVQRGAVGPLIDMLQSPDPQLREMSAFALGRLAQDTHNQAGIAHSGGLAPLLKLLDSKNGSLQHNSVFALYGLADNEDNVAELIKVGGVQKLQDGEFIVQATRDCVAKTLKRLEEKIHGRVLSHLLYLIRTGDKTVQRRIALALAHLCSPDDQRIIFIDSNVANLAEIIDVPDDDLEAEQEEHSDQPVCGTNGHVDDTPVVDTPAPTDEMVTVDNQTPTQEGGQEMVNFRESVDPRPESEPARKRARISPDAISSARLTDEEFATVMIQMGEETAQKLMKMGEEAAQRLVKSRKTRKQLQKSNEELKRSNVDLTKSVQDLRAHNEELINFNKDLSTVVDSKDAEISRLKGMIQTLEEKNEANLHSVQKVKDN